MDKVAILYICTGKYDVFWKDFFESYEKFFLINCHKEYFVFTDAETLQWEDKCDRIHKIYQKHLGWPDASLMRYHMFDTISERLLLFDYVYFMNANCMCVDYVGEEFIPSGDKDILAVQHPGEYNKKPDKFSYDRNPLSTAYIPKGQGRYYVCGGVNGGKAKSYVALIKEIKQKVDIDKKNNVVAKWHDESHFNRYIVDHDNYMLLSPAYCYAEGWKLPFNPIIIVREKSNYIDVTSTKYGRVAAYVRKKMRKAYRFFKRYK